MKNPTAVEQFAIDVLPFAQRWEAGTPVCTSGEFSTLLTSLGKNVVNPMFSDLLYFLAGTPTDETERNQRSQCLLNARIAAEGAENTLDLMRGITDDHNAQRSIPVGAKKQSAVDILRSLAPDELAPMPLSAISIANIEPEEVSWLVPGLIARGELSVLGADGGTGKGLWQAQLIAYLTTGNPSGFFPNAVKGPGGRVLIFSGEDDPGKVLRPRLKAAGANISNVFVNTADDYFRKTGRLLTINSDEMSKIIRETAPDLVIVDPYQAFFPAEAKMAERNQMRSTVTPFRACCRDINAAGLFIAHSNKKSNVAGRQRLADSSDLWDLSRCVLMMGRDRATNQIYISNEKNSYAAEQQTVLFSIEGTVAEGIKTAVARFQGKTEKKDYDFIMEKVSRPAAAKEDAAEAIENILNESQSGSMESEKLRLAVMEETGCSERTYKRAKADLKEAGKIEMRQIRQKSGLNKWFIFYRGDLAGPLT